jgi:tol-pal system protein YbgF
MRRPAIMRRNLVALGMACALVSPAWALFEDTEARKAILELRQVLEEQRQVNAEGSAVMRRSILEVSTQAEQWRRELGQLRGQYESLTQTNQVQAQSLVSLQAQIQALEVQVKALEARIKAFEPIAVDQDGTTLLVSPPEKTAFDRAMALLLASDFAQSAQAYVQLLNQYPNSAYTASVLYWLGNAQYASKDLKGAVNTHKRMVVQFPMHSRVPEAMLAMGNAHQELGDTKAARVEWEALLKAHPNSEAARTARERLKQLRPR